MRAEIISVGTELLLGQIVDTNAAYLAQRLAEIGIDVYFKQTVGDNSPRVEEAVRLAISRADVILITGGLGPTEDDLTVAAVAAALRHRMGSTVIRSRVLRITGEGESAVEERIKDLLQQTEPTIAPYAKLGEVHLRLTAKGPPEQVDAALARGEAQLRERLGDLIYGVDDQTLEDVVAKVLTTKHLTLAVAESCTGGTISSRLTNIPGSSAYFLEGVVAYSNEAKVRDVGVDPTLLATRGAVSPEVAEAMAGAIRRRCGAEVGLGVTGIAGPTGGTPDKPVGLVYLGLDDSRGAMHRRLMFGAEAGREGIRVLAAQAALNLLRLHVARG